MAASKLLGLVVAPYLVTRAVLLVAAQVASLTVAHATADGPQLPPTTAGWFTPLLGWDAGWYLRIAASGFQWDAQAPPTTQQSVVFFPLYPALVRLLNVALGDHTSTLAAVALVLSSASALVGLCLMYRLVERDFSADLAQTTVWYYLAFPVSFFLSAAYAEPLFLVASVGSLYAARLGRWPIAGLAAAAAALTRPYGVLIALPLAWEFFAQQRRTWSTRPLVWLAALWLALPIVALGSWMVYLARLTGDPLVFVHAQVAWGGQQPTFPFDTLVTGYGRARDQQLQGRLDLGVLQFGVAASAALAALASWRSVPITYAIYASAFCAVVLSGGSTISIWRHVYLIFPLFIVAARAGLANRVFDRAYVATALTLSGLFIALVATGWSMIA